MFFEEAAADVELRQRNQSLRILETAVREPDLDDAEVLFRRNGDSVDERVVAWIRAERFARHRVEQVLPHARDAFVEHLERETAPVAVLGIFPLRRDAGPHDEKHALFQELLVQQVGDVDDFFDGLDAFLHGFVAAEVPGLLVAQVVVDIPGIVQHRRHVPFRSCLSCFS